MTDIASLSSVSASYAALGILCAVADVASRLRHVHIDAACLAPRLPGVSALHLDYWLWFAGRRQGPAVQPYHRTLTTAY